MLIPTNAPAEAIVKMQQENFGYQSQIDSLTSFVENNNRLIEELQPLATWDEVADVDTTDNQIEDGYAPISDFPGMIVPNQES